MFHPYWHACCSAWQWHTLAFDAKSLAACIAKAFLANLEKILFAPRFARADICCEGKPHLLSLCLSKVPINEYYTCFTLIRRGNGSGSTESTEMFFAPLVIGYGCELRAVPARRFVKRSEARRKFRLKRYTCQSQAWFPVFCLFYSILLALQLPNWTNTTDVVWQF